MLFVTSIASSNPDTGIKATTGPNISSWAIRMSWSTSVNMVGSKKCPGSPGSARLPPVNRFAPSFFPITVYFSIFSSWDRLMTGPISVSVFSPSPSFRDLVLARSFCVNSSFTFSCTMTLLAAVQRCPVVPKAPQTTPSTARSISASSIMMIGFLPPSSSDTRFMSLAHSPIIHFPVSRLPVNEMALISG